jgi:5-methyltetrahydrofolate--homocysteine methyltransferase
METRAWSPGKEVVIGADRATVLIGDRINPTGRRKLTAALQAKDMEMVRREALAQVKAGADILDINVGASGVDEVELLPEVVRAVAGVVDVPLSLDSKNPKALKAALEAYEGKAIVNSVSGEEASLEAILPVVKEHGAAVVGLTINDGGIPAEAEGRLAVARRIIGRARDIGIPAEDVIIDCLVMTVATDTNAAQVTLDSIRLVKKALGVNQTLGASNISHGLPERETLNAAFLALAIGAGATCPYVNVGKSRQAVLAADLLLGRDRHALRFIRGYRQRRSASDP